MIWIINKEEKNFIKLEESKGSEEALDNKFNSQNIDKFSNDKIESQYILKIIYDSNDERAHKFLREIFGEKQLLGVSKRKYS